MEQTFRELLDRLNRVPEQCQELREGVRQAIVIAELDPEMSLTRARKVLEYLVRRVYERRVGEPAGTRPLENLLQRIIKDGYLPRRLAAYANTVRELGNLGTHGFGEAVTGADVLQSLQQLIPILEWYFEKECPEGGEPQVLSQTSALAATPTSQPQGEARPLDVARASSDLAPAATALRKPIAVVPKGLSSFDASDRDFFLELLPGQRDKDGLPESIHFWKDRIEAAGELTFTVALIYGPSGCGKSSLVKAGLLPRLDRSVVPVYLEAMRDDTEFRLAKGLKRACPSLDSGLDLAGMVTRLRQDQGFGGGRKVLIVLDQFEQWLHAQAGQVRENSLVAALRQCDGLHVQCILTVRDDFWLGISRFFQLLEIRLVEDQNVRLVDLFELEHAGKVLRLFGQYYGRLPDRLADCTPDQHKFLDEAVLGLAQDGKVIPVRLSLFADMMKERQWTPSSLKEVGGAEGVGVAFLEETFTARTANPEYRAHQKHARVVLQALLPETGSDIKGRMRSSEELARACQLNDEPKRLARVLCMLDRELHLITPTEREPRVDRPESRAIKESAVDGQETSDDKAHSRPSTLDSCYQLTHDYLVPSLREWLNRKRGETWRGRAELRLEERTAQWGRSRESRFLPNPLEYMLIMAGVPRRKQATEQRRLLRAAHRWYGGISAAVVSALLAFGCVAWELNGHLRAEERVRAIRNASIDQLPQLIPQLQPFRRWAAPHLAALRADGSDPAVQLHAALALLPVDRAQVEYLRERLLDCPIHELPVIRDALLRHGDVPKLVPELWEVVRNNVVHKARRFNAALALATLDRDGAGWNTSTCRFVVDRLLESSVDSQSQCRAALAPVGQRLIEPAAASAVDGARDATQRLLATSALVDFARGQPDVLAASLVVSEPRQYSVVLHALEANHDRAVVSVQRQFEAQSQPGPPEDGDRQARARARASVGLLALGERQQAWSVLKHAGDPSARSYWLHEVRPDGLDPAVILERLGASDDALEQFALLQALGEFPADALAEALRRRATEHALELFNHSPRRDLHAAAAWLLRQWGHGQEVAELEQARAPTPGQMVGPKERQEWFINTQGMTLVILPVGKFQMGADEFDPNAYPNERPQRCVQVHNQFAIADREVPVQLFLRFYHEAYGNDYPLLKGIDPISPPQDNGPMVAVSWFEAVAFCRWLSDLEGVDPERNCYPSLQQILEAEQQFGKGQEVTLQLPRDVLDRPGYRLPTEAEWEYACRAGSVTRYSFGNDASLLDRYGWFSDNTKRSGVRQRAWPGGFLKPNDFGLFDMLGNVAEWCWDRHRFYEADGDNALDSINLPAGSVVVVRGGGWDDLSTYCRSTRRNTNRPGSRNSSFGFRVVWGAGGLSVSSRNYRE